MRAELGPEVPLVFLMGADQLLAFDTWREWTRLPQLAHFGVGERPGYAVSSDRMSPKLAAEYDRRRGTPADLAAAPAGRIVVFPMRPTDLSSTGVRNELKSGRRAAEALPPQVLDYIEAKRLYRS
jgi:nicotinate-nucleotide adenylyltransferase